MAVDTEQTNERTRERIPMQRCREGTMSVGRMNKAFVRFDDKYDLREFGYLCGPSELLTGSLSALSALVRPMRYVR